MKSLSFLLQDTSLEALDYETTWGTETNSRRWIVYTVLRNIFIDNYRKIVHDHAQADSTEQYYQINLLQDAGFDSAEGAYGLGE